MIAGRNKLILILIFSETCYLYPLYQLAAIGLGEVPALSFWLLLLFAAAAVLINLKLTSGEYRKITLAIANLCLFVPVLLLLILLKETGILITVISGILLGWLILRSNILAVKSSIDVFVHFDLSVIVIFIVLLIIGGLKIPLGSGITWLMVSFLLNLVCLSLYAGKSQGYLSWLGAVFSAIVLLPLFFTARYFLPLLFEPAQFLYAVGKPIVGVIGNIIGFFFIGYMTYHANRREESSKLTTDTNTVQVSGGSAPDSPVFMWIMKIAYILVEIVIIIAAVAFAIYLLRLFLAWLLRLQGKAVPHILLSKNKFSWRRLFIDILLFWDRLWVFMIPWLPVRLDIAKAYRTLLKWGLYKRFPKNADETPYEYLNRLKIYFPQHEKDLDRLTIHYVQYKYGKESPAACTAEELKSALRRIFLPCLQYAKNR